MATITTSGDLLAVALTTREKIAAVHGDIDVPLSAVREVRVEPDALAAVRGLRAPGLAIPRRTRSASGEGAAGANSSSPAATCRRCTCGSTARATTS